MQHLGIVDDGFVVVDGGEPDLVLGEVRLPLLGCPLGEVFGDALVDLLTAVVFVVRGDRGEPVVVERLGKDRQGGDRNGDVPVRGAVDPYGAL